VVLAAVGKLYLMRHISTMKIILSFLVLVCIQAAIFAQGVAKPAQTRVPAILSKYTFGMLFAQFKKMHPTSKIDESSQMVFRMEVVLKNPVKGIKEVTFYFNSEGDNPMYEMIIVYPTVAIRDAWVKKNYGASNAGKEWLWPTIEGYNVRALKYSKNFIIAATIKDTVYNDGGTVEG